MFYRQAKNCEGLFLHDHKNKAPNQAGANLSDTRQLKALSENRHDLHSKTNLSGCFQALDRGSYAMLSPSKKGHCVPQHEHSGIFLPEKLRSQAIYCQFPMYFHIQSTLVRRLPDIVIIIVVIKKSRLVNILILIEGVL